MNSRLTQERSENASPSRQATIADRRSHGNQATVRQPTTSQPQPTPLGLTVAERHSSDPLRATDRYRLVMPYSLRV